MTEDGVWVALLSVFCDRMVCGLPCCGCAVIEDGMWVALLSQCQCVVTGWCVGCLAMLVLSLRMMCGLPCYACVVIEDDVWVALLCLCCH